MPEARQQSKVHNEISMVMLQGDGRCRVNNRLHVCYSAAISGGQLVPNGKSCQPETAAE